jgi:uncharacterized protein YxeA
MKKKWIVLLIVLVAIIIIIGIFTLTPLSQTQSKNKISFGSNPADTLAQATQDPNVFNNVKLNPFENEG